MRSPGRAFSHQFVAGCRTEHRPPAKARAPRTRQTLCTTRGGRTGGREKKGEARRAEHPPERVEKKIRRSPRDKCHYCIDASCEDQVGGTKLRGASSLEFEAKLWPCGNWRPPNDLLTTGHAFTARRTAAACSVLDYNNLPATRTSSTPTLRSAIIFAQRHLCETLHTLPRLQRLSGKSLRMMVRNDLKSKPPIHPSLKGERYVLYPRGRWVQNWDIMFLILLLYYCFSIPVSAKEMAFSILRLRKATNFSGPDSSRR